MTGDAGQQLFWCRSTPFLEQVNNFSGAGQHLFWCRSTPFLVQVNTFSGAGGIFGEGPAPPLGTEPPFAAQVPTLFSHLRQNTLTPAPRMDPPAPKYPYTCAKSRPHLRHQSTSPATHIMYKSHLYNGMASRRRFHVQVFQGMGPKGRLTRYLNTKQPSEMH